MRPDASAARARTVGEYSKGALAPSNQRPGQNEGMNRPGRLEVVCGPMFAGKTEELLRRVRRAEVAGRRVVVINHALDLRHGTGRVASHAGLDYPSVSSCRHRHRQDPDPRLRPD